VRPHLHKQSWSARLQLQGHSQCKPLGARRGSSLRLLLSSNKHACVQQGLRPTTKNPTQLQYGEVE